LFVFEEEVCLLKVFIGCSVIIYQNHLIMILETISKFGYQQNLLQLLVGLSLYHIWYILLCGE